MTTITALPTAPDRSDPTTFSDRGDALLGALATFVSETNTVAGEVVANRDATETSAATSAGSATAAAGSATAAAGSATEAAGSAITAGDYAADAQAAMAAIGEALDSGPVISVNGRFGIVIGVQDTLVSGTTIKTINGTSVLGSGDIVISFPAVAGANIYLATNFGGL